jgi:hypothetical protein
MVAKAIHRKAVPIYEAREFRSGETVGALVAVARNALWEDFGREDRINQNNPPTIALWKRPLFGSTATR